MLRLVLLLVVIAVSGCQLSPVKEDDIVDFGMIVLDKHNEPHGPRGDWVVPNWPYFETSSGVYECHLLLPGDVWIIAQDRDPSPVCTTYQITHT